jgi:hypothetical protein
VLRVVSLLGIGVLNLEVQVLVMYGGIVIHLLHKGLESLFVSEVVGVVELREGEGVGKDLHGLSVLALDRQFHQFVRILLVHLVGVGETRAYIEDLRIVELLKVIVNEAEDQGDRRDLLVGLGLPPKLHVGCQAVPRMHQG